MYLNKKEIKNRLQEHYEAVEEKGNLLGVFLKGSQNYVDDLFLPESDIDTIAVFVPNEKEIILNVSVSKPTFFFTNGEEISLVDIRSLFSHFKKPSVTNMEPLFTEHYIVNDKYSKLLESLHKLRDEVAYSNQKRILLSVMGIANSYKKKLTLTYQKQKKVNQDLIEFGYSRKHFANIKRFQYVAEAYSKNLPFSEVLKAFPQEEIYKLRTEDLYEKEEAMKLAEEYLDKTKEICLAHPNNSNEKELLVNKKLDEILFEFLKAEISK